MNVHIEDFSMLQQKSAHIFRDMPPCWLSKYFQRVATAA